MIRQNIKWANSSKLSKWANSSKYQMDESGKNVIGKLLLKFSVELGQDRMEMGRKAP